MDQTAVIQTLDREHCVATWNQTVIAIFRYSASVSRVARLAEVCRAVLASGKPATSLWVIEPTSPVPDGPAREAMARWSRDVASKMAQAVIVAEGTGFRVAAVRGVGVALTAIVPHKVPFKFAGTVDEGLIYLEPHLGSDAGGTAALKLAVTRLREQFAKTELR